MSGEPTDRNDSAKGFEFHFYDGGLVVATGGKVEIKALVDRLLSMDLNYNRGLVQQVERCFESEKEHKEFNGDFRASNGKLIRLLIDVYPDRAEINLVGGGSSIEASEIQEEFEKIISS